MMSSAMSDPWRVSNEDRAKHDQQFFQLNPVNGFVTGDQAKSLFLQSGLPPAVLGHIWGLADMNADGKMDRYEFSIAMHLIHMKLKGMELPKMLPGVMKNPPAPTMGTFGAAMGLGGMKPPISSQGNASGPRPLITNGSILMGQGFNPSSPSNVSSMSSGPVPVSSGGPMPISDSIPSMGLENRVRTASTSSQDSIGSLTEWAVPHAAKLKYTQHFNTNDRTRTGFLSGNQARSILLQSNIPQQVLAKIWALSDIDGDGRLTCEEFCLAMHLTDMAKSGSPLPSALPLELIPPSYRRKRSSSIQSTGSSVSALVQPIDLAADMKDDKAFLANNTFEDKRKMNFEKGQAELEKRRQALLESQRKEQEEREKKEREEQEKRERIRQEQERRRQMELEKQLAKQRELEQEKEEHRRKVMEQREAARREMERQRQLEWEKQRRQDLMTQRQREQEAVCHLKAHNKALSYDLEKLDTKMQDLNKNITETRSGVTGVKSDIDSMKGQRDTKVTLINSLKLQLKEQNDRMLILNQEKANMENKLKSESEENPNIDSMNIVMHSFNNKKITLNQLRDVLSNMEKTTAQKLLEIDDSTNGLKGAKKELTQLIEKTDVLRKDLEKRKQDASSINEQKPKVETIPEDEPAWGSDNLFSSPPPEQAAETNDIKPTATFSIPESPTVPFSDQPQEQKSDDIFGKQNTFTGFDDPTSLFSSSNGFENGRDHSTDNFFSNNSTPFPEDNAFSPTGGNKNACSATFDDFQNSNFSNSASQNVFDDDAWIGDFNSDNTTDVTSPPSETPAYVTTPDNTMVKYRALYAFEARNSDELSIMPGDIIMVPEKQTAEPGWLGGELKDKTGWFPAAYVEPVDGSAPNNEFSNDSMSTLVSGTEETVHIVGTEMKMTLTGISEAPEGNGESAVHEESEPVESAEDNFTDTLQHSEQSSFKHVSKPLQGSINVNDSTSPIPGQGQEVEGLQAQAQFPWRAKKENHLTFNKGDVINVKEQQDMWWYGECDERHGWFPKSYVKLIAGPKRTDSEISENPPSEPQEPTSEAPVGSYFMAIYSYQSNETGDLSFNQGDIVLVTKSEGDWWTGSIGVDRTGIFPSNYVQKIDSEGSKLRKPEIATVIAPYAATGSEQLTLQRGQLIQIRKRSPSGWWEGELQAKGKQRQIGWFPASYVKLLSASGSTPNSSARNTPDITNHEENADSTPPQEQVIALFAYEAQNGDELSLVKGELVTVINKDDPSWWKGQTSQGAVGLFPANYVQPEAEADQSLTKNDWMLDNEDFINLDKKERKRQRHIHELIDTEQSYMEDMSIVIEVFYEPLKNASVLSNYDLQTIFVNWNELIICNVKILKALRVRKKMTSGFVINMIGDILCETIPHLSPYIRFCSCQLNAAALLQQKTERSPEFKSLAKKCAGNPRAKGMPLSSFLLKPMQRITKYPLLIKKILEYTSEDHPDYQNLLDALHKAESICNEVNESVRERENSDRLEWLQTHVQCEGVMERLTFNSTTNSLGQRKYLHSGTLIKAKSNKELMAFLVNDFLLLSVPIKPVPPTASIFSSEKAMNSWYKMYRQPLCLNEVMVKQGQENDDLTFQIQHTDRLYTLKAINNAEKLVWVKKLEEAIKFHNETEKKKMEKQHLQKSQKTAGVGRLLVVVCEGHNLTPSSSNRDGRSDPYCEINMGTQEHKTKVVPGSLNPKWNASMQFLVRDLKQDVLCITVYDRDLFSPNDFLGRTEIKVADIFNETKKIKGPIVKVLPLHEVETGQVTIKLDLHLFDLS